MVAGLSASYSDVKEWWALAARENTKHRNSAGNLLIKDLLNIIYTPCLFLPKLFPFHDKKSMHAILLIHGLECKGCSIITNLAQYQHTSTNWSNVTGNYGS